MNDSKIGLSGDFTSPYVEASARPVQTGEKEKTMTQEFYPMGGEQWVTADRVSSLEKQIAELAAEKEEMLRMLYGRDLEIERLTEALGKCSQARTELAEALRPFADAYAAGTAKDGAVGGMVYICNQEMGEVGDTWIDPAAFERAAEALGDEDE